MQTYMLWYGGPSYAVGGWDDIERFSSIKAARDAFWSRADFDPYYPCVENPEAWIWYRALPPQNGDLYPDAVMTMGPRGGVRVTPA